MHNRNLKVVLVAFVSLGALLWAIQNVVNLESAYQSVAYVTSNVDHAAYPKSFGPAITSPVLVWSALMIILIAEFTTGLLAAKGAFDMYSSRRKTADQFNASKRFAILGCGAAVIVWFGIFTVIGGAYFQMWQTAIGDASFTGAMQYAIVNGAILIFIGMRDQ
jgi:predicted small integral membrane protein